MLALGAVIAWFFPEKVLTVDSGEVKADVIVVLGGQPHERTGRALELYRAGAAPKILLSGTGDDIEEQNFLGTNGVPADVIVREGKSRSTRENARFSIPILRELGAKRVIIVTSWYHSRRAVHCFEHYASDIQFFSRPSYVGFSKQDSHRRSISDYIRSEYVKLAGYWMLYGVCPIG